MQEGKGRGPLFKSLIYLDPRVVTEAHASSTPTCVRFQGAAGNMVEPHTTGLMVAVFSFWNFWELSWGSELSVLRLKHPSQMYMGLARVKVICIRFAIISVVLKWKKEREREGWREEEGG